MKYKRKEVIGDATLYLADCLDLICDVEYDSIVTDPPFGMAFVSSRRNEETKHKAIANDEKTDLLQWVCNLNAEHSKYIFCRWDNLYDIPKPKSLITWVKNNHSMGDLKHEHGRKTEVCAFYNGAKHFFPENRPNDVVCHARTGNELHPTQKPVSLMQEVVSWADGVIFDPFMGSGTTGVAALSLGKKFIGIELDEDYFEVACQRIREEYNQLKLF